MKRYKKLLKEPGEMSTENSENSPMKQNQGKSLLTKEVDLLRNILKEKELLLKKGT